MLIDLKRLWEITLIICNEIDEAPEEDFYIYYTTQYSFESFLNYFSIKIDIIRKEITYYNDDKVPYEDFTYQDFNTLPLSILEFKDEEVKEWLYEKNKERVLKEKENRKIEIDRLRRNIEILKEQVKKLENG